MKRAEGWRENLWGIVAYAPNKPHGMLVGESWLWSEWLHSYPGNPQRVLAFTSREYALGALEQIRRRFRDQKKWRFATRRITMTARG